MTKLIPKMDEYWIARIKYWPGDESKIDVILIYYVWENGDIDFIPFQGVDGDPIRTTCCEQFELLEKVEVEKYQ